MTPERLIELSDNGLLEESKKLFSCIRNKSDFVNFTTGEIEMDYDTALNIWWFYKYSKDFQDCLKIIHADNRRYNRLLSRILFFMNCGSCLFITLTFTDDVLENTTQETRRKYVRRFIKENSSMYIANIDYGAKTNREHYHGVIVKSDPKFIDKWQYGYSSAKFICDRKDDKDRIARYMLKIANHFVKSSVRRNYVIYSRNNIDLNIDLSDRILYFEPNKEGKTVFKEILNICYDLDSVKNEQLMFWEHLPKSCSSVDIDDIY